MTVTEVYAIESMVEDLAAALAKSAGPKSILDMVEDVRVALAQHVSNLEVANATLPKPGPKPKRRPKFKRRSPKTADLLSIDHPASGTTLRPGPIMPALVAVGAEVSISEPADNNSNHWEMHLKLYLDMPTTASHTIHLWPALCRRSEWVGLALGQSAGITWALGNETGHITCCGPEYGLCVTNTRDAGSRYAIRIPRDALAPPLSRALVAASKLGLPFAPGP